MTYCVWLYLLSISFREFIHSIASIIIAFHFMAEIYSIVHHNLCIHSSYGGHVDVFHLLPIMSNQLGDLRFSTLSLSHLTYKIKITSEVLKVQLPTTQSA